MEYGVTFVSHQPKSVREKMKESNTRNRCKYNIMVNCEDKGACFHCGWNPKEHERRLARIYDEMNPNGTYNQLILKDGL